MRKPSKVKVRSFAQFRRPERSMHRPRTSDSCNEWNWNWDAEEGRLLSNDIWVRQLIFGPSPPPLDMLALARKVGLIQFSTPDDNFAAVCKTGHDNDVTIPISDETGGNN